MTFKTLKNKSEGYFIDRKSKFYSFAYPIENEDDVKERLKELRKKYYDARHIAYAYRLSENEFGYSDDGEPKNSAGMPIFGIIRKNGLSHILIAVVRYFGGKKLGIPGLINAYSVAAQNAIENAKIIEKKETVKKDYTVKFTDYQMFMNYIKKQNLKITDQIFTDKNVKITLEIEKENFTNVLTEIEKFLSQNK